MAKASDNPFPSILLVEQAAAPATPAAGQARLYRGTDNKLYLVDDAGTATEVGGGGGSGTSRVPVVKRRTSGNVPITSSTWMSVDTGMDITLAAAVGDIIAIGVDFIPGDTVNALLQVDVATIVGGAIVNRFGGSEGIAGLLVLPAARPPCGVVVCRPLVSGDISGGSVTLRLVAAATAARSIAASTFDPLNFWAENRGQ